jgi:hypothetical protein
MPEEKKLYSQKAACANCACRDFINVQRMSNGLKYAEMSVIRANYLQKCPLPEFKHLVSNASHMILAANLALDKVEQDALECMKSACDRSRSKSHGFTENCNTANAW